MTMKKVLVVETNQATYGARKEATGLWLGETTEFITQLQATGWQVDYVSPRSGYVPVDPRSLKYLDAAGWRCYQDPAFQKVALARTQAPEQVDPTKYTAIYFAGGHGVMWDFPTNRQLQVIAEVIYQNGGYVTSVCHGIAGLFNLKLPNGTPLIAGKRVTGFTRAEEVLAGKRRLVPVLNQNLAQQKGAKFVKRRAYAQFAVTDGRLITGQNPFSATAVAKKLLVAINQEESN